MKLFSKSIDNSTSIRVSKHREVMLLVNASTEAPSQGESAEPFVERTRARLEQAALTGSE